MRIDHIGIVVKDLEGAKKYYQEHYNFKAISSVIDEPVQKVKIVFIEVSPSGFPTIELIQPVSEGSAVYNFLQKNGGGLHHLSYEVKDLDKAIEHFKNKRALMVGKVYSGAGHNGRRVVWFYTSSRELIELIEGKKCLNA